MALLIGIDIGKRLVKVVQIEHKTKYVLHKAFLFPTPYIENDVPKKIDTQKFLNQIISKIPLVEFKESLVGITIPSSCVKVMTVDLPKMSKKELAIAAVAEAKRKLVPPPTPSSIFEQLLLEEVIIGKIPRYEMLVVQTEKMYVQENLSILEQFAGKTPALISPSCYTIPACLSHHSKTFKEHAAFIDIGYDSIGITIAKKGNLYFFRDITFGLKDIITRISKELTISPDEAERVIREKGVPEVDIDINDKMKVSEAIMMLRYEASLKEGDAQKEVSPLELRAAWQTEIEGIIHEIRRSLMYYKDQAKGGRVENIFFLGGGAKINRLVSELSRELGGNCRLFSPQSETELMLDPEQEGLIGEDSVLFVTALSIAPAIIHARKSKRAISFLPLELKKQESISQRKTAGIIFVIIIFLAALLGFGQQLMQNRMLNIAISRLSEEAEKVKDASLLLETLKTQKSNINEKSVKIRKVSGKRVAVTVLLEGLSQLVPENVTLVEVSISPSSSSSEEGQQASGFAQEPGLETQEMTDAGNKQAALSKDSYTLGIKAACFGDFEEAVQLAQEFKKRLEGSRQYSKIELLLPELEKIIPNVESSQQVVLTQPKTRTFEIRTKIVKVGNEKF
ncbi:MAG: pilus assembly protein PilM [Candidatus Omnitrophica bacterium]|nr:pilus assembly protein PilM [Candidatus Omnitrophota bacterium]